MKNGGGRIIVTSSTQGRHGTKFGAAYSASKWGIIGLMKSAALELGVHKITVNAVIPGLIDTPLTRHRQRYAQAVDDLDSKQSTVALEAEAKTRLSAKSPLGAPWIEPEAIAPAVVFLASDAALHGEPRDLRRDWRGQRQLHGVAIPARRLRRVIRSSPNAPTTASRAPE